jgi:peroxiredoxin Q/BCP
MVEIGEQAPDFCLRNQTEKEQCLDNFRGKWIVLYFYPKDNTSGCTLEAKDFTSAVSDFNKLKTEIIGISPDSVKSHQNFISKHALGINLLSDPEHKVLEDYGAWQKKKLYGREFMGVVRSTFLINPEGKVEYIWPKVKVQDHVDNVKNKLIELQNK